MQEGNPVPAAPCPSCSGTLVVGEVRTAIWQGDRLSVVEDIPALICRDCAEQYYDDDVSEALRRLNEEAFPRAEATRTIEVDVFSLAGRIRTRGPIQEDVYVE